MDYVITFKRGETLRKNIEWKDADGNDLFVDTTSVELVTLDPLTKVTTTTILPVTDGAVTLHKTDEQTLVLPNLYFKVYADITNGDRLLIVSGELKANE